MPEREDGFPVAQVLSIGSAQNLRDRLAPQRPSRRAAGTVAEFVVRHVGFHHWKKSRALKASGDGDVTNA